MKINFIVDTNILVCAYDLTESEKRSKAQKLLDVLCGLRIGILTTQVLTEFLRALIYKNLSIKEIDFVQERAKNIVDSWNILTVKPILYI